MNNFEKFIKTFFTENNEDNFYITLEIFGFIIHMINKFEGQAFTEKVFKEALKDSIDEIENSKKELQ